MRIIKFLAVHCTASNQNTSVQSLKRTWQAKGWNVPGYHYLVLPDGEIVHLLNEKKPCNGVQGYNTVSINIAYVGGINSHGKATDNRTQEQKASLYFLLENLRERYPRAHIQGHRDFSPDLNGNGQIEKHEYLKECPCFDAQNEYKNI